MHILTKSYQDAVFTRIYRAKGIFFQETAFLLLCTLVWMGMLSPAFAAKPHMENLELDAEITKFAKVDRLSIPFPELPFWNGANESVSLEQWEGQMLVMVFWATWCMDCSGGLSALNALHKALHKQHVQVIPLSVDYKGTPAIQQYFQQHTLTQLDIFIDPKNTLFQALNIHALPTTLIINEEGTIIRKITGRISWEHPDILKWLLGFKAEGKEKALLPVAKRVGLE